jgi:hypothetical protein
MNFQTALLDVRQMREADRLTVAAGTPITELMIGKVRSHPKLCAICRQNWRTPCTRWY